MRLRLSSRAVATLKLALQCWQNELGHHTIDELAEWHPELRGHEPFSIEEIDALLARLGVLS